jgi:hypothetical protein
MLRMFVPIGQKAARARHNMDGLKDDGELCLY